MGWEEMKKKKESGEIVSLIRSRLEIMESKQSKEGFIASTWYLKGDTDRVITVQPRPHM